MYFPAWRKAGKKVVLLPTSDWGEIDQVAGLMRVAPRLRQTRVVVVGSPRGTAAACADENVKKRLGAEVVRYSNRQVIAAHKAIDIKAAEAEAEKYWTGKAKRIVEPKREEIVNSARLFLAVQGILAKERAQAITSSHCMGSPAKGCLTFSKLNDLGLVGACEGDMDSTLTMLIFAYAFGVPGFISDPVFDTSRNALIHFHCTSCTKMDGPAGKRLPFSIRTQTDSGRGVALEVENRVGQPVTCAKFINLDTMLISTGKIIEVTHSPLGCRTQFVTQVADARSMFHNWGAGVLKGGVMTLLHRVVFYGDHLEAVKHLGVLMGFNVIEET
jgi:L-fucose isomerase-like protein